MFFGELNDQKKFNMPQGLKSNNKFKIILFLVEGVVFVLIGAGFLISVQKVSADYNHIYDFSSEAGVNKWACSKSGSKPSNPDDCTSPAASGDYAHASSSDDARWKSNDATGNLWDSQIYMFEITEDVDFIQELAFEWEGYGNYGETCPGYDTYFYIWKVSGGGSWSEIESHNTPGGDVILGIGKNVTDNIGNYIYVNPDDNNSLVLMASTQRGKSLGESCSAGSECCSGYCNDGVCCDRSCGGDCEVCNLEGSEGACITRVLNDNTEIAGSCHYCDGYNALSQRYDGDNGLRCNAKCTYCDNGTCRTRETNDNTEVTTTCYYCNGYSTSPRPYDGNDGVNCNNNCSYCDNGTCRGRSISDGTECATCTACDASGHCSEVLTEDTTTDTGWGFNHYHCVGSNKRCYQGVCRTCGGYVYNDGCANCAHQGGKACWYHDSDFVVGLDYAFSCNQICGSIKGCVQANWNDDSDCSLCKHWWPDAECTFWSKTFAPIYRNALWVNTCNYRSGANQSCSQRGNEGYSARFCVCRY